MNTLQRLWIGLCLLAAALAAAAGEPAAAARPDRISASDEFAVQIVSDPQISPDGRHVAYVRQFADVMTDRRYTNLWIVAADGSGQRALTTGRRSDVEPRWSPDGTRIAFVGEVDGQAQLMVLWPDSGRMAQLTHGTEPPHSISWSPDGRTIAFTALVRGHEPRLAELPAPPEGAKWSPPAKIYDQLVYRFDHLGYLPPGYRQIFVVSADGGAPRQVTTGDFPNGGWAMSEVRPAWTPDGRYLIASVNRRADYQSQPRGTDLWEFSVADGAARALTTRQGPDESPAVSPDGRHIAYTGYDDEHLAYQVTKLYLMNRDGSGVRVLTPTLDRDVGAPVWAADGSGVYFEYTDHGDTKVGFVSRDGRFRRVADHLSTGTSSYGFGTSFSVSRSGAIAYTYGNGALPGDVALAKGTATRVLTAVNAELLQQKRPGVVEPLTWASSKDGRTIEGWLVKPPDFDPAKKYPLILEIHGGPFANYGDRFDIEKQSWASAGYLVLYANPRGSTSYGQEFAGLIHHAYPGDDFYDLDSGVDAVLKKGFVDASNLFVTGGSGGGVLTSWVIEHTDRYRAAAILYPVINWNSFVLTSDIPWTGYYWLSGDPWKNAEQYQALSLSTYVEKVHTPALLMTGEEDYRTPITEAEQFYAALKLRGVESVLVRVPGEPHGITRFPSHHVAKMLYVQGWFDQHRH
ncbi:MAG: S9 family peptidase [Proteobacteria bacterium]|nr:S9 family peptidase [Pseudomonadota bacterium]